MDCRRGWIGRDRVRTLAALQSSVGRVSETTGSILVRGPDKAVGHMARPIWNRRARNRVRNARCVAHTRGLDLRWVRRRHRPIARRARSGPSWWHRVWNSRGRTYCFRDLRARHRQIPRDARILKSHRLSGGGCLVLNLVGFLEALEDDFWRRRIHLLLMGVSGSLPAIRNRRLIHDVSRRCGLPRDRQSDLLHHGAPGGPGRPGWRWPAWCRTAGLAASASASTWPTPPGRRGPSAAPTRHSRAKWTRGSSAP